MRSRAVSVPAKGRTFLRSDYFFSETKRTRRTVALASGLAMLIALSLMLGLQAAKLAHAATTFTVNFTGNENDLDFPGGTFDGSSDGKCDVNPSTAGSQCTLRAAIQQANVTTGADTIKFNIPSSDPNCNATTRVCTIFPASLPPITKPVTIDGYTQGDATSTTTDDAEENTLTQPGKTNAVLKIELDGTGTSVGPQTGVDVSNVVIRGLVVNDFDEGIFFLSGRGNRLEGNFIGTDPTGTSPEGNDIGVHFSTTNGSTIGGTSPAARNIISGNDVFGVWLEGGPSDNKIQGNLIGTDKNGGPLGNGDVGVLLSSSGNGNRLLSNSIFANGTLGIDLGSNLGVNPNDPKDPDTGPNSLQNFPGLSSPQVIGGSTLIEGELNSTPSTKRTKRTFTIQFFSSPEEDPSGFGEGKTYLGEIQVTTNRQGNASFGFEPGQGAVSEGELVTATATRNSTGDTSEFSEAERVDGPVIGG